jgi:hypothetical protein
MKLARRLAALAALGGWIYSWYLFRGVRNEYASGDLGPMPSWLVLVLGLTTTGLIACSIAAWMRVPLWPLLAVGSAVVFLIAIVGSQQAVMQAVVDTKFGGVARVSIGSAVNASLRIRSAAEVILIAVVPTMLTLTALSDWIFPRISHRPTLSGDPSSR